MLLIHQIFYILSILCILNLLFIKYHQMLNMWRTREKVVSLMMYEFIFFLKQTDVSGLGDGVAAEVNNSWRRSFQ